MSENRNTEYKSIRFLKAKSTDWAELAKDCVSFANAQGGHIYIGVEDDNTQPPFNQKISDQKITEDIQKQITQRTINVAVGVTVQTAPNESQFIDIAVFRNVQTIASTNDGKYYIRIGDHCRPIPPDELARLVADKNAFIWEEQVSRKVPASQVDLDKKSVLLIELRESSRTSAFVREMSDDELLEYYFFKKGNLLTNLGILWLGTRADRASLLYPPAIQVIRYNRHGEKTWKLLLDDYYLNPKELLQRVLNDVPDWQESMELSDGLFRTNLPFFPMEVVRELTVNALAHRTYTTRGDIFINIFPDRMEIHSPGRLPYGVTPENILSQSIRRNDHLCKVLYDLGLMEKEGSGYDLVYARLLAAGKPIPEVCETDDRVIVVVKKQYISKEVVHLMDKANKEFQLRQKETISLGLIAQHQSLSAVEISKILNQREESGLSHWLGRLSDFGLIIKTGRGKGTQYAVNPEFVRKVHFKTRTNLKNINDHRLEELIYKVVTDFPRSSYSDIHKQIGEEINESKVKRFLKLMVLKGLLEFTGQRKWTRYSIKQKGIEN